MLFIRRFLIVSYLASGIVLGLMLFNGKEIDLNEDLFVDNDIIEMMSNDENDNYEVIDIKSSNDYEKETYKKEEDNEVLLELYIPRISLRQLVYNMDSSKNKVNLNVEVLKDSDVELNLYFLAAHSGGRRASYFDNLIDLEVGDVVWIYREEEGLGYVVDDIFFIEKKGYFDVSYGSMGNRVFLITCSLEYKSMQLVVTGKLVYSGEC